MNTNFDTVGTKPEDVAKALASGFRWTLIDYQALATRTLNNTLSPEMGLLHATALMASDAGECLSAVKAHVFYKKSLDAQHGDQPGATLRDNLIEEAGDQLWAIAELATRLGITLEDIARGNMAKLLKRFPTTYFDTAARDRADKAPAQTSDEVAGA